MRDFCERERLRNGKYLGAGEKEREGVHWPGEGEREMWLAAGKEIEINFPGGESDDEGDLEGD
jgi:hypothetical protein